MIRQGSLITFTSQKLLNSKKPRLSRSNFQQLCQRGVESFKRFTKRLVTLAYYLQQPLTALVQISVAIALKASDTRVTRATIHSITIVNKRFPSRNMPLFHRTKQAKLITRKIITRSAYLIQWPTDSLLTCYAGQPPPEVAQRARGRLQFQKYHLNTAWKLREPLLRRRRRLGNTVAMRKWPLEEREAISDVYTVRGTAIKARQFSFIFSEQRAVTGVGLPSQVDRLLEQCKNQVSVFSKNLCTPVNYFC